MWVISWSSGVQAVEVYFMNEALFVNNPDCINVVVRCF